MEESGRKEERKRGSVEGREGGGLGERCQFEGEVQ